MKLGLFGGTFNPPHIGHVALAKSAVEELSLDKLILMPARIPPHKALPGDSASLEERYDMSSIAASLIPRCEASRLEMDRDSKSYTAETLARLCELYPGAGIVILMGGDMLLTLDRWYHASSILARAEIASAARDEGEAPLLIKKKEELENVFGAKVTLLSHKMISISSSEIREALAAGKESDFLPPEVAGYIRKRNLYR